MTKIEDMNTHKSRNKILLILAVAVVLIVIGYIIISVSNPGSTTSIKSHDQFIALDKNMQAIYKKFKSVPTKVKESEYTSYCHNAADKKTWDCYATIAIQGRATSLSNAVSWNAKYSSVLNNSDSFALENKTYPRDQYGHFGNNNFGKKFTVSDTEKYYLEKETGIECTNYNSLSNVSVDGDNQKNGSKIDDGIAQVEFDLSCKGLASSSWYDSWSTNQ